MFKHNVVHSDSPHSCNYSTVSYACVAALHTESFFFFFPLRMHICMESLTILSKSELFNYKTKLNALNLDRVGVIQHSFTGDLFHCGLSTH